MSKSEHVKLTNITELKDVIVKGKYHDFTNIKPYIQPPSPPPPSSSPPTVPNLIHFIWIGSPIPEKYINNIITYYEKNPTHTLYLWQDQTDPTPKKLQKENIKLFSTIKDIKLKNQYIYDNEINLGCKADIIRYEILHMYGGMYTDVDSECISPLDDHFKHPLLAYTNKQGWNNVQNAFLVFSKGHPFLDYLIKSLSWSYYDITHKRDVPSIAGPTFVTKHFYFYNDPSIKCIHQKHIIYKGSPTLLHNIRIIRWTAIGKNRAQNNPTTP